MIRSLNQKEKELVAGLRQSAQNGRAVLMEDFLKTHYFTEEKGRALIIQIDGKYAVLYLKNELYDDALKRTQEINEFYELIAFLEYLSSNGYITIYKNVTEKMYFIQDGFNAVKVINETIVLNTEGDYSSKPDAIHNSDNKVIYKGILFRSDQYYLVQGFACGSLIVSDSITGLLADISKMPALEGRTPTLATQQPTTIPQPALSGENHSSDEKKAKGPDPKNAISGQGSPTPRRNWLRFQWPLLLLNLVVTAILLGLHFYMFKQNQAHRTALAKLSFDHRSLKDSLQDQTNRVANLLLQISSPATTTRLDVAQEELVKKYYGIDISHHNGDMVSRLTNHDSITFVLCKATEGISYVDPYLAVNWNMISQKNLLLGVYHFYKTADDPIHQATFFLSEIEKHGKPDLPLVIDIESGSLPKSNSNNKSKTQIQDELHKCLTHIEAQTGRKPMIYTGRSFANRYLNDEKFSQFPLWLADYNKRPKTPTAWVDAGYRIWQKTDNYPIEHSHLDFDVFHGKLSDLLQ